MKRINGSGAEMTSTPTRAIDRRRFLEIGSAASLAAVLPGAASATVRRLATAPLGAQASASNGLEPHAAIYDERFEAARRFAAAARSAGIPVHSFRGDVTQLWYSHLYPLWKRAPVPIAGLTGYAAMFCLERLAWDQQLRMAHSAHGKGLGGLAGAAEGAPLHLWLIASPAQLAALTA